MKRNHIAVLTLQGDGEVYPTLAICAELVNRGYHVTYPIVEKYSHKVAQTGAIPVVFEHISLEPARRLVELRPVTDPKFWHAFASIVGSNLLLQTMAELAQLEPYYQETMPDLILYGRLCFAGKILATRMQVPAAQVTPHFAAYMGCFIRDADHFVNPEPMLSFARLLDAFMFAHGVDGKDHLWASEKLNIILVPRVFQMFANSFDETFRFVGPCLDRTPRGEWTNTHPGKPLILISGSQVDRGTTYFKVMIAALSNSRFHVVLSLGDKVDESSLGTLPDNFEINRDAYNLAIFPHAALTICQSGMGTVMESLYYGVPVLAVPRTPVHGEVGYRVAELGVGACISEDDLTPEAIRQLVDHVLTDATLIHKMSNIQSEFRCSGGAVAAADHIDIYLDQWRHRDATPM